MVSPINDLTVRMIEALDLFFFPFRNPVLLDGQDFTVSNAELYRQEVSVKITNKLDHPISVQSTSLGIEIW